jgi:hypothetical protein
MMKASAGSTSVPAAADGRNALLEGIKNGIQLKKVDASSEPKDSGDKGDFLDEIRKGITLKPVGKGSNAPKKAPGKEVGMDNIAEALKKFLDKRKNAVGGDSVSESDESADEDWIKE